MGEINALHPFREGKGRTQRIFFAELVRRGGYKLNFSQISPNGLLEADIAAYKKDYSLLVSLLETCCDEIRP
jgi:cell filamentation protein